MKNQTSKGYVIKVKQRWYVIRTNPQSEHIAAASLEREGLSVFFPEIRRTLPRENCKLTPMFPGYIFLRCEVSKIDCPPIHLLPGISGWVRFGGISPPVPDKVMISLMKLVETINSGEGLWNKYKSGEIVRVVSANMDSLAQVIDEPRSPQDRIRVLLQFMDRLVPTQVAWQDLRPLGLEQDTDDKARLSRRTRGRGRWIQGFGPRAFKPV